MVCYSFEFLLKKSSYGLLSARSNSLQTPLSLTLPEHLQTERNLQSICFIANFRRDKVKTNEALVSAVKFYSGTPQSLPPWSGLGKPRERLFFSQKALGTTQTEQWVSCLQHVDNFNFQTSLGLSSVSPKRIPSTILFWSKFSRSVSECLQDGFLHTLAHTSSSSGRYLSNSGQAGEIFGALNKTP